MDAETSDVRPSLSEGQRRFDLEMLVENIAYDLANLVGAAAGSGRWAAADGQRPMGSGQDELEALDVELDDPARDGSTS